MEEAQLCTVMYNEKNRRNLNLYNCDFLGEVCSFEIFTRIPELTHWMDPYIRLSNLFWI